MAPLEISRLYKLFAHRSYGTSGKIGDWKFWKQRLVVGNEENSTRKIDTGIKLAIARCTRLLIGEQRNSTKKMDTSMQKSLRREATSQERGMRCCASQDRDYIIAARARRTTRRVAASKQEKILENGGGEREARLRLINAGASSSRVSSLASSSLEKPSGRVYC